MCFVYNLLLILILISSLHVAAAEKKDLNIMGFFPFTGKVFRGGKACLLGAEMALQDVNARDGLLTDYNLNLIYRDSKCAAGPAVNMMYEMLYEKPTKIMILGPGCSVEAEVTAEASSAWNITHLSWGGASPLLSDKEKYPRFFRVAAPDTRYNFARIALARLYKWRKIATLNVAMDYFSAVTDHLVTTLKDDNEITIISEEIFDHDPMTRIQNLKRKDARIIFAAGYENHGKWILCAAYQAGLYGPKVVWMFPGWYRDQWWKDSFGDVPCTEEQMAAVAEGSILTGFFYASIKIERGIANMTVPEYEERYKSQEAYRFITEAEYVSPNCYDSVWGIALALNCTDATMKSIGHPKRLDEFEYSDIDIGDIVTSCTNNVSFLGITGQVKFDRDGEIRKNVRIEQVQGGKKVLVGIYRTDVENWFMEWYNGGIVWKDGVPPRDSTFVTETEMLIPQSLYVLMSCFAGFGIVLAVSFVIFNVIHRENQSVKLSSPNINNVLLLGCIITYSSVFMESLQQKNVVLCKLRTFTFTIGFSMAFGALFSKTWRVYRIFSNKKLLHIRIKDSQLIGIVLVLLVVLCLVLVAWEVIDPLYMVVRYLTNEVYLIGNDAEVHPYIRVCTSELYIYFSWTICILEGAVLAFGAFLSFETRKVHIAALNDSRLIGMSVYNVVVLSAVAMTLNLVLEDKVALLYGVTSGILIIGTTSTQLVIFIPKIMAVYYPHRVDSDVQDGSRLGTMSTNLNGGTLSPRDNTGTNVHSVIGSFSNNDSVKDSK